MAVWVYNLAPGFCTLQPLEPAVSLLVMHSEGRDHRHLRQPRSLSSPSCASRLACEDICPPAGGNSGPGISVQLTWEHVCQSGDALIQGCPHYRVLRCGRREGGIQVADHAEVGLQKVFLSTRKDGLAMLELRQPLPRVFALSRLLLFRGLNGAPAPCHQGFRFQHPRHTSWVITEPSFLRPRRQCTRTDVQCYLTRQNDCSCTHSPPV